MKTIFPNGELYSSCFNSIKSKSTILQKILFVLLLLVVNLNVASAQDQGQGQGGVIYKDWLHIAERPDYVDVSARIIKCDNSNTNQVHFFIFNEGAENSNVKFTVTITNLKTNESFSKEVTHKVDRAVMLRAMCGDETLNDLKVDIPNGYDPTNISISITFN